MSGIYIAFRRTAPVGAPWWQRAGICLPRMMMATHINPFRKFHG